MWLKGIWGEHIVNFEPLSFCGLLLRMIFFPYALKVSRLNNENKGGQCFLNFISQPKRLLAAGKKNMIF